METAQRASLLDLFLDIKNATHVNSFSEQGRVGEEGRRGWRWWSRRWRRKRWCSRWRMRG